MPGGTMADESGRPKEESLFRLFVEVFSVVAALLLFASAYIQYRLFAGLDIPFFLVASTEDILLGGFSILATILDQFTRTSFLMALPTHLIVFAAVLAMGYALARLTGRQGWWWKLGFVAIFAALILMLRAALADSFPLTGSGGSFRGVIGSALGPVDANGPLGWWSFVLRLIAWTALVMAPVLLAFLWLRRREGAMPGWRAVAAWARGLGDPVLILLFLGIAAGTIPNAILQSFTWGKGKVTHIVPRIALEECEGGEVFVVWSGSKAEVMRCFEKGGERDFVVLRGEHTVIELERQSVRGSTLVPNAP